ncbi:MAG TPA: hypothetical protein DCF42_02405 [Lachnospiraceae bacterium]|nr:hypothetical protein [Lachnospiraceae bacterium]
MLTNKKKRYVIMTFVKEAFALFGNIFIHLFRKADAPPRHRLFHSRKNLARYNIFNIDFGEKM